MPHCSTTICGVYSISAWYLPLSFLDLYMSFYYIGRLCTEITLNAVCVCSFHWCCYCMSRGNLMHKQFGTMQQTHTQTCSRRQIESEKASARLWYLYRGVGKVGRKSLCSHGVGEPGECLSAWVALKTPSMNKSPQFDPFKYQMELYSPLGDRGHAWTHCLVFMMEAGCHRRTVEPREI